MVGLGVSTVCTITNEVTIAIVENMWEQSVNRHMPKSEEDFRKKYLTWRKCGSFPSAGLP